MKNGIYIVTGTCFFNEYYGRPEDMHIFPSEEEAKRCINEEMLDEYDKFELYFKPFGFEHWNDEGTEKVNGMEKIWELENPRSFI